MLVGTAIMYTTAGFFSIVVIIKKGLWRNVKFYEKSMIFLCFLYGGFCDKQVIFIIFYKNNEFLTPFFNTIIFQSLLLVINSFFHSFFERNKKVDYLT
jgi:hypothetical protein